MAQGSRAQDPDHQRRFGDRSSPDHICRPRGRSANPWHALVNRFVRKVSPDAPGSKEEPFLLRMEKLITGCMWVNNEYVMDCSCGRYSNRYMPKRAGNLGVSVNGRHYQRTGCRTINNESSMNCGEGRTSNRYTPKGESGCFCQRRTEASCGLRGDNQ